MDSRKRQRFEMINIDNFNSDDNMQGVASTANDVGTATIATIGGQNYLLSNSATSPIPANILLSICEENTDEAEEYIIDQSALTSVKRNQVIATQTNNNNNTCNQSQMQQNNLITTVPQLRVINQAGKILNTSSFNPTIINGDEIDASSLNSLNLPPGCEIYVIKEVFNSPEKTTAESTTTTSSKKAITANSSNVKLDQTTSMPTPVQRLLIHNNNITRNLSTNATVSINTCSPTTSISCATTSAPPNNTNIHSFNFDPYKKRDDRRRETHNEVERRRRNKLNSCIYRLKELLPPEEKSASLAIRTPSNNSKTQILIKAFEYIKTMQEEMNSLRECLTENESLRSKNERLQAEINSLRRAKQQQQQKRSNNNNLSSTTNTTNNSHKNSGNNSDNSDSCEITLNSLNSSYANVQLFNPSTNHHLVDLVGLSSTNRISSGSNSVNVKYSKRELIITDYVD